MGKKETFEKITTSQFLLMQLHRRRGKELETEFHTRREQGRVLALLKMADSQTLDDMAVVLGVDPDELTALLVDLEAQGLVECEAAEAVVEEAAEEAVVEEAAEDEGDEADDDAEESEDEDEAEEADDEDDDEAEEEPAPQPVALGIKSVRITEAGRAWEQPATDLPNLVLQDFDEDELAQLDAGLDKFITALEGQCGATAAQMMQEERKRREEVASRGKDRRDDRGGRDRGGRDHGRGDRGFDRKGRGFDKDRRNDRKFDRDHRDGRKFDKDRRDDRGFGGRRDRDDRGFGGRRDRDRDDRGFGGRRDRDDRGFGKERRFGRDERGGFGSRRDRD